MKNYLAEQKGQALILVISILVVITIVSSAALVVAKNQNSTGIKENKRMQAYYIADAGLTKAIALIKNNCKLLDQEDSFSDLIGPCGKGKIGDFTVTSEGEGIYKLVCTGIYPNPDDHPSAPSDFFCTKAITARIKLVYGVKPKDWPCELDKGIWTNQLDVNKNCRILANTYCSSLAQIDKELVIGSAEKPKSLTTNAGVRLTEDGEINGDIYACLPLTGNIDLAENFTTTSSSGLLHSMGNVEVGKHSVTRYVKALGNVTIGTDSQVKDIFAGATVTVDQDATVQNNIVSTGNVNLGENARVQGSVWTLGRINFGNGSHIDGAAYSPLDPLVGYTSEDRAKVTGGIHILGPLPPGYFDIPPLLVLPALPAPVLADFLLSLPFHSYIGDKTIDLSSETRNGVYFVQGGNLTLTCSTGKYSGKAVFAASPLLFLLGKGNIVTPDNLIAKPQTKDDSLCLVSGKDIVLGQNNDLNAFLWATGKVKLSGGCHIKGHIICDVLDAKESSLIEEETVTVEILSWQ